MNISTDFKSLTTPQLHKRKKLNRLSLNTIWIGGAIGIIAAVSRMFTSGAIESTTLFISIIALLVSIPTYYETERIKNILVERSH